MRKYFLSILTMMHACPMDNQVLGVPHWSLSTSTTTKITSTTNYVWDSKTQRANSSMYKIIWAIERGIIFYQSKEMIVPGTVRLLFYSALLGSKSFLLLFGQEGTISDLFCILVSELLQLFHVFHHGSRHVWLLNSFFLSDCSGN